MSALQIIMIALIAIVLLFLYLLWKYKPPATFVGYGWRLRWDKGKVWVVSRLLDSPSGREGVRVGSIVLEFDGHPMDFDSAESFVAFMSNLPRPEHGAEAEFRLQIGSVERVVTLVAETIQQPIPYHKPLPPIDPADEHLFTVGMFYCMRTGQVFFRRFISRSAVQDS